MRKILPLLAFLALAGCASSTLDVEWGLCDRASEGLSEEDHEACRKDVAAARYNAWNDALAKYRGKPRARL